MGPHQFYSPPIPQILKTHLFLKKNFSRAPGHAGIPRPGISQACAPCIGRQSLNHWTAGEVPKTHFFSGSPSQPNPDSACRVSMTPQELSKDADHNKKTGDGSHSKHLVSSYSNQAVSTCALVPSSQQP